MTSTSNTANTSNTAAKVKQQLPRYLINLRRGVWIYYFLVIFEGALRKWLVPGLSTPLLVIREPFLLIMLVICFQHHLLDFKGALQAVFVVGILSIPFALIFGHGNLFVALYGARILLLHFPFIFIVQKVFDKDDIIRMGKVTLWIAIPMAILIGLQFYSPQSAWVNRGVGGDEAGAGFSGAMGYYRPPGTFSFTNGTTLFFGLSTMFAVYFWLAKVKFNKLVLTAATISCIAAIPLSISRALFFEVLLCCVFAASILLRQPKNLSRFIAAAVVCVIVFFVMSKLPFFQTSIEAFTSRFDTANESEGGVQSVLLDRYLGGLWDGIARSIAISLFGIGVGAGTNVGAQILLGKFWFLGGEGEWGRLVVELGPILGLIVVVVRLRISIKVGLRSFKLLGTGEILPWMILSFGLVVFPQGGWAQPTALGFSIIAGGLMLASISPAKKQTPSMPTRQVAVPVRKPFVPIHRRKVTGEI